MKTKVESDYKKDFNLGYEITKESDLKEHMFKGQETEQNSTNAMQTDMLHYIDEVTLSRNRNIGKSVNKRTIKLNLQVKTKGKNIGKGLSF